MPTVETIPVHCAVCKVEATAFELTATVGTWRTRWVQPPAGWWVLLECSEPHLRCPRCLAPREVKP